MDISSNHFMPDTGVNDQAIFGWSKMLGNVPKLIGNCHLLSYGTYNFTPKVRIPWLLG